MIKIEGNKFLQAVAYINRINQASLLDIDFTDLLGKDLTKNEKEGYFWAHERKSNAEIIAIIIHERITDSFTDRDEPEQQDI
jgi:hypothetical protein